MGLVHLSENYVVVTPADKQVVVEPEEKMVYVSSSGPPGPQGPIGPAGGEAFIYDRNGVPANPWIITHNLGRIVGAVIVGDDGIRRFADEQQSPPYNVLTISFAAPFSGKALVG